MQNVKTIWGRKEPKNVEWENNKKKIQIEVVAIKEHLENPHSKDIFCSFCVVNLLNKFIHIELWKLYT